MEAGNSHISTHGFTAFKAVIWRTNNRLPSG